MKTATILSLIAWIILIAITTLGLAIYHAAGGG